MSEPIEMTESLKQILERGAKRAEEEEILIGIDPRSYLGKEILKQSREIIALRSVVRELTVEINAQKKERQKLSCLKKILLTIANKIK